MLCVFHLLFGQFFWLYQNLFRILLASKKEFTPQTTVNL